MSKLRFVLRLKLNLLLAIILVSGLVPHMAMAQDVPREDAATDVDPALWVVGDEDTTIYLFGTIHVLRPGLDWFDEAVKTAFDSSDQLVLEIVDPPAAEAQLIYARYALDASGTPLREKLNDAQRADYEAAMKTLGLPVAAFDPLDPWAAAVTMQVSALAGSGYQVEQGIEKQLTAAALASGKPIAAVETMEGQLQIFDALPQPVQIAFLAQTAADLDDVTSSLDAMVDIWGRGDAEALGEMVHAGMTTAELKYALMARRNAEWAKWIQQRLKKPGTIFMAVGAGHLGGPASVQHMLGAYDIAARRIEY